MTPTKKSRITAMKMNGAACATAALLLALPVQAAVPGITGPAFDLAANPGFTSQPDGASIYTWGYGCNSAPAGFAPFAGNCPNMQLPGPTLIVTEGQSVTVTLTNNLPPGAGNTSIVFPGFNVTSTGGVAGLLTQEAVAATPALPLGNPVTYTLDTTGKAGTHAYYSGTQPNLQIEMGLFGAIVVLPGKAPASCKPLAGIGAGDYRLATSAFDNANTCYDREYMFQLSEMNSRIHDQVLAQVNACSAAPCPAIFATTDPYRPNYFLLNGRSMPDDMDSSYAPGYVHQPYNANPHMHPGELVLMRVIGQGRQQHPFHFHGNHARVLARDGNLIVSTIAPPAGSDPALAGPLLFTTPTVMGQTQDQIFAWTGQGLNWDVYGFTPHTCNGIPVPKTPGVTAVSAGFDAQTHEYCPDHGKGIPATPPDPNIVAIGQWYGGTPYLGLQAPTAPNTGYTTTTEPPGTLNQNPEAGYAYMWHSHNEREITTNDVFPGGMMSMLLIDPPCVPPIANNACTAGWYIDETQ